MSKYLENALILEKLPKVGENPNNYNFGYSNLIIWKIEKANTIKNYQIYLVFCKSKIDFKKYLKNKNLFADIDNVIYSIAIKSENKND